MSLPLQALLQLRLATQAKIHMDAFPIFHSSALAANHTGC